MKQPKYASGTAARKHFEAAMTALFRAPKTVKIPAKPAKAGKKGGGQ